MRYVLNNELPAPAVSQNEMARAVFVQFLVHVFQFADRIGPDCLRDEQRVGLDDGDQSPVRHGIKAVPSARACPATGPPES